MKGGGGAQFVWQNRLVGRLVGWSLKGISMVSWPPAAAATTPLLLMAVDWVHLWDNDVAVDDDDSVAIGRIDCCGETKGVEEY